MKKFLSILSLESKAIVRSGMFAVLLFASVAWMLLLPLFIKGDGTAEGARELYVRFSLGGVFVLLAVSLLASATGSVAKERAAKESRRTESISRFFHIMGTVNQPNGLFRGDERQMRTVYTACMDTERSTYYFTTYDCRKIRGVRLKNAHLDLDDLTFFPMKRKEWMHYLN